jgi:hypothetical protein
MANILDLKTSITSIKPLHDTPMGRIHPYWARKPLNILRELIRVLSKEGDTVCDPFMGCGTTVFGCLLEKRNVIATDINPLASLIVQGTLSLCRDPKTKMQVLRSFVETFKEAVTDWFINRDNGSIIERERYSVYGEFENGNFKLEPIEVVLRMRVGNKAIGRRAVTSEGFSSLPIDFGTLLKSPVDFEKHGLTENSRIAIPKGALLSHYFTKKNMACINIALMLIEKGQYDNETKILLRLFLSSTLPLLRLSDYKASSQWPYWRPKKRLTSRNPVLVFERRLGEFKRAQDWLLDNIPPFMPINQLCFPEKGQMLTAAIDRLPVQEVRGYLTDNKIDLIMTDPPYGDHVPYLEYSSLWTHILGLPVTRYDWENEIVKTDAEERQTDNSKYLDRLLSGLDVCAQILKTGGYLVWFYQDSSISNWAALYNRSREMRLKYLTLIPMPKQRRSMKTVAAPGKTFDGDLILVFQKTDMVYSGYGRARSVTNTEMTRALARISNLGSGFFYRYADLIHESFEQGWIDKLSNKYSDIREIVK